MESFEIRFKCINPKCEKQGVETDWIHSDATTVSYNEYMMLLDDERAKTLGRRFVPINRRFHIQEKICECKYEMQEIEKRPAEPLKDMGVFIPKAKGDRGKNYYTRYTTSKGGVPEWNPVSNIGGTNSKTNDRT